MEQAYEVSEVKSSNRMQTLSSLVNRLNEFLDTCFEKLVALCISKQQEQQVKEIHRTCRSLAEQCSQITVPFCSDDDSKLEDECARVQEVYKSCFANLEMCFVQLLGKIYQIESDTFRNFKFRDTISLFDAVL